ncbi:MAG: hypothetical protein J5881_04390 [Clostridia bacterium]|nr:hypothetical protein [Clostridia bacterium]
MEKEEIIEKMKELRENIELKDFMEKLNSENPELENTKRVENVKYLGEIIINEKKEQIYLVYEKTYNPQGECVKESICCYTANGELLGIYSDSFQAIALKEEYKNNSELYKELNELDINGQLDLEEIEKAELEQIAKSLGIDKEEIKAMSSMELAQKIEEHQDSKESKKEENKEEQQTLNKEETKNITDGKQEIKLGTRVDEYKTLGKTLDLNESEYSKVVIVYSEKLKELQGDNEKINNTMYSFVAIKKDGTAEVINDRLKVDERTGDNSLKESIKIDANEKARKDNKTKTRFQIIGKNGQNEAKSDYEKETLSVEPGQYGEIKAYYGKGRTRDNVNIETQLETSNIKPTSIDIRKMQAERKGTHKDNNEKMAKEADYYFNKGVEEISMYSADGDKDTVILADYLESNKDIIVDKIMQNEIIANSQFGEKDIEEKIQRVMEDEKGRPYTQEEIREKIDEIEKEIVDDASNFPTRNRR